MADTLSISRSRCYNHPTREAVALCTVTGKPYCRECIVEHEGKMVAAHVVADLLAEPEQTSDSRWKRGRQWLVSGISLLVLWYGFFLLGRLLLSIPSRFHEGNFW